MRIMGTAAPAHGGASVLSRGEVAGTVTSGEWGHRVSMNLAYAFVKPELAMPGTRLEVDIIGVRTKAEVINASPYDPEMKLPKS